MIHNLIFLLILIGMLHCRNTEESRLKQVSNIVSKDSIDSNQPEVITINCDSIYNRANVSINLMHYDSKDTMNDNYRYIFSVNKQIDMKKVEIYRDTIISTTCALKYDDYNNDNVKDILIQNISDVSSNWTYYLFLVDKKINRIKKIKGFNEIKNPRYLAKYDLIENLVVSGVNWTSFYKISSDSIKNFNIEIYKDNNYKTNYEEAILKILKLEKKKKNGAFSAYGGR